MSHSENKDISELVAIVGMSGRFPGADNIEEFWDNLRGGVESIATLTTEELRAEGIAPELIRDPRYVRATGVLDGIEQFDAGFFNLSPHEAAVMDPQDRLFLECSWEALENAGYDPERYGKPIGVFGGELMNTYMMFNVATNPEVVRRVGWLDIRILNDKDFLTTQVSYRLNLRGPSVAVQTACSTSLVAIHLARESLLTYQCDMALAGGVCVRVPHRVGYLYEEGSISSPDGHCRAFDAEARGMVGGNGVALVVLKRLEDALDDSDTIHAVLRGTAVNNDGSLKVGYTAPSVDAQAEVVTTALETAEADAADVSYIEAHGTGTPMGDPVEIAALSQAFRGFTDKTGYCAIGSVKTNIGHLDAAAGVAGLIKTVLALEHRQIPSSLNFERPNPEIDFDASPFFVNAELRDWPTNGRPRLAGVSSLGVGGTNVHAIVEEAPEVAPSGPSSRRQLLLLSARGPTALARTGERLAAHLRRHPKLNLADVAYTLCVGRRHFPHRRAVLCGLPEEDVTAAIHALEASEERICGRAADSPPVVFLFPGQGTQQVNMARELYDELPAFRRRVERCADLLRRRTGLDLLSALYPGPGEEAEATRRLEQTDHAQPALFVIEYALARQWMDWGAHPRAMIGHSVGEWVAACLAGVVSLEDALELVALRGQLMQSLPRGAMLAVELSEQECRPLLGGNLSLAAINGPRLCVISGPRGAVEALTEALRGRGVEHRRLRVSHAFHSAMMEPALKPFREAVRKVSLERPEIPYISNLTGTWISTDEAVDADYWARHLREAVRFSDGARTLLGEGGQLYLEVGPGHTLSSLLKRHDKQQPVTLSSLPGPKENRAAADPLWTTLGRLWTLGVEIDAANLFADEDRRRVPLPTYPFERQRHWVEPQMRLGEAADIRLLPSSCWLRAPVWRQSTLSAPCPVKRTESRRVLLVTDGGSLTDQLGTSLEQELVRGDCEVFRAGPGETSPEAWLEEKGPVDAVDAVDLRALEDEPGALFALVQALRRRPEVPLTVVTAGGLDVSGVEELNTPGLARYGVCRALSRELPELALRTVDVG